MPRRVRIRVRVRVRTRTAGVLTVLCGLAACRDAPRATMTLGAPIDVATPAPAASNTPSLVKASDGTVWLSWTERRADSSVAIRAAAWRNGAWDSTRTISEARNYFVNWADFPAVTVLRDGALAAHWLERNGNDKYAYGVQVVRSRDAGRTWSAPVSPHTDGLAAEHGFVSLWAEGEHDLGLAWLDGRKSAMPDSVREMTVRTAVVRADGSLTKEAVLDARTCDCCQVASARTNGGRIVVYRDRSPEEIRDIVAVRAMGDTWSTPIKVHDDRWHYPGCPVNGPAVASRGDTVLVAWFTAANDAPRVLAARSVDGGAHFEAPVRIDNGNPIGRAAIVAADDGSAVVTWMEHETPETASLVVRRIAGATTGTLQVSEPQTVASTSSARSSGFPRVAVLGDTLLVAWTAVKPSLQVRLTRLSLSPSTNR